MTPANVRAVLFDMDGVVVDSLHLHLEAWRRMLPEMGLEPDALDYKEHFGRPSRFIVRELLRHRDPGREPAREEIERWTRRKVVLSCEMARRESTPIAGFHDFIRRVRRRRLPVALASAAARDFIDAVLAKLEARDLFDIIVSVDDVGQPKPDPEIFLQAAAKLRVPIAQCLIVEDSETGIQAAVASGGICCALLTMLPAGRVRGAQVIAKDYGELARWLWPRDGA
jgi:HAD superfamily hydrolase (TIGR01509 family)